MMYIIKGRESDQELEVTLFSGGDENFVSIADTKVDYEWDASNNVVDVDITLIPRLIEALQEALEEFKNKAEEELTEEYEVEND